MNTRVSQSYPSRYHLRGVAFPSPIASKSRSILSTFSAESWEIKAEILAVGPYVDLRLSEIFRASCQSVAYAPLHKDSAGRDADLARVDEGSGYDTLRSGGPHNRRRESVRESRGKAVGYESKVVALALGLDVSSDEVFSSRISKEYK